MEYHVDFDQERLIVSDGKGKYKIDLTERLIDFCVATIKFLATLPPKREYEVFRYQLSKSSTSIGANYEESQATTRKEFHMRISICLREARETHFWFRIIEKLKIGDPEQRKHLLQESLEIKLIFGAIESKTR